jgi:ATP adenylyltransferase
MKYIEQTKPVADCIFCHALSQDDGPENLIVYRGKVAFVILNRYPYTSGHLMIVPMVHEPTLEILEPETRAELMELSAFSVRILRQIYNPEAFNMGANIGAAAGAGVAGHIHFHVVPRWGGDTNFMTTLADTRVLPESLEDTYRRIVQAWAALSE